VAEGAEGTELAEGEVAEGAEGAVPAEGEAVEPVEGEEAAQELTEEEKIAALLANSAKIEELLDELNNNRKIEIYANIGNDGINLGDSITLIAVFEGYENTTYTKQWQYDAGNGWVDIDGANGNSYTFVINESNMEYSWRVQAHVTETEIPQDMITEAAAEMTAEEVQ